MNRKLLFGILAACLGWQGVLWAAASDCPTGTVLKKVGNVQTTDVITLLSPNGMDVRLIVLTCTSTACTATLNDAGDTGSSTTIGASTVVIEPGAAASATVVVPGNGYFDPPLRFKSGVVYWGDGNVAAIGVYACQQP